MRLAFLSRIPSEADQPGSPTGVLHDSEKSLSATC